MFSSRNKKHKLPLTKILGHESALSQFKIDEFTKKKWKLYDEIDQYVRPFLTKFKTIDKTL